MKTDGYQLVEKANDASNRQEEMKFFDNFKILLVSMVILVHLVEIDSQS